MKKTNPIPRSWLSHTCFSLVTIIMLLSSFGCAIATDGLAGRINGEPIRKDEFYSSYRGHYAIFSYKNGHSPDQKEKEKLVKETWLNITRTVILRDHYRRYKLSASPSEVLDTLSKNIPVHILQSNLFKVNGQFDEKLYQLSLNTDKPENLSALRRQYQEFYIPSQKLKTKLIEKELLTLSEKKRMERIVSGKATLELNIFDQNKTISQVSEGEIAAYYMENQGQFLQEPLIKLNYCRLPVVTDATDLQTAQLVADSVLTQLRRGRTMEELALNDPHKQLSFIEHGFVKSAELPAELASILNSLSDGEYSSAQAEMNGWVIYQKVQNTKTLTFYRSLFIQSIPRSASLSAPEALAKRLQSLAISIGLSEAANEFDLKLFSLPVQNPDSLDIFRSDLSKHLDKIRQSPSGTVWEPLYSAEKSAWFVFEVASNQQRKLKTLDEVKIEIRELLARNNSQKMNLKRALAWQADPSSNPADQKIILEDVNWETSHPEYPIPKLFVKAMHSYLDKDAPSIIAHRHLLIIPVVRSWSPGSEKATQTQIQTAFSLSLPDDWFDKWLDQEVSQAKVIKYLNQ